LALKILAYMEANPAARDTLSGIADWWLAGESPAPGLDAVQESLNQLVAAKLALARPGADRRALYYSNVDALQRIQEILKRGK
jgi:hypothetical protein